MNANLVGALVDSVPEIGIGIYFILLRAKVVGNKPGKNEKVNQFLENNNTLIKIAGPGLVLFGICMFLSHI